MEIRLFTSDFEASYILLNTIIIQFAIIILTMMVVLTLILSNTKEATSTEGDEKKHKGGEHTISRISEF